MIRWIYNTEIFRLKLLHDAWLIFQKDIRQEFKTRYSINAIFLFALVTLIAVSFSIGTYNASADIKSALLWIIIFFSAMSGLSHIFVREEEKHTADTLKLVAQPTGVFLGKFLFNLFLLYSWSKYKELKKQSDDQFNLLKREINYLKKTGYYDTKHFEELLRQINSTLDIIKMAASYYLKNSNEKEIILAKIVGSVKNLSLFRF